MGKSTKISRNMSILQFQRRLIRTARSSPKLEALNLFGIVYSNLIEFFQVRVPLDNNRAFIMEEWANTFDMFCQAVRSSFINLFISNEIDALPDSIIQKAIHQRVGARFFAMSANEKMEVLKTLCAEGSPLYKAIHGEEIGVNFYNQFYHRFTIAKSLVSFWDETDIKDKCTIKIPVSVSKLVEEARNLKTEIVLTCSRSNISMPSPGAMPYLRTQADFQRFATKWAETKHDPSYVTARLVMRLVPHEISDDINQEDMSEARIFVPEDNPSDTPFYVYNFGISLDNPIFFEFDKVAKKIMCIDGVDPYPALRYMDDALDDYHGIYFLNPELGSIGNNFCTDTDQVLAERVFASCERNEPILIRTPVRTIEHVIPKTIALALFGNIGIVSQLFACNTFAEIKGLASRKEIAEYAKSRLSSAQLTLYRTGKIQKHGNGGVFIEDDNAKLVIFIALICKKDAHIFVECRARDDELNNLWLVKLLQNIADIIVVGKRRKEKKVHAKLWAFRGPNGTSLSVVSTGNFSDGAQSNFSDTYLITPVNHPNITDPAEMLNREIWLAMKFAGVANECDIKKDQLEYHSILATRPPCVSIYGAIRTPYSSIFNILTRYKKYARFDDHPPIHIRVKCNHVTDMHCIEMLNAAAHAGCTVDVMVRTTSTIPLMDRSPNLNVRSIMGRYLEHDRIFVIEQDDIDPDVYIGSIDLMSRNLKHRIESLVRIPDEWLAFKKILIRTFDDMFERETDPKAGFFNYKV